MHAIVIREPGGPDVLELREVPTPTPSRGEVQIRVRATAVNRADVMQRLGRYPAPPGCPADIPGLEIAGEVVSAGEGVTELVPGDRVFGIVGGGGYAEYVVVHARAVAKMPAGLPFVDAAAVPEAFITAWDAMIDQAGLTAGNTVLVHAAASGVGTAAVQIAHAIRARVIGTLRSGAKLSRIVELGLTEAILAEDGRFAEEVLKRTGGVGVDVVLDLVGGDYVAQDLTCLAERGRIVVVGMMAGSRTDLDLGLLMVKRATLRGTILRARPLEEKIFAARALERHIAPLLSLGAVRPVVDRVLNLAQAGDAHRLMQSNTTFGKIVLTV
jgi:NADPH2:quinone reductase